MPKLANSPARTVRPKPSTAEEAKAEADKPREGLEEFAGQDPPGDPAPDAHRNPLDQEADRKQTEAVNEIDLTRTLDDDDEFVSILYWGPWGTGKTTHGASMSTLDHPGRLVAVNAEGGMKRSALTDWGIDPKRITPFPPQGTRLTYDLLEKLFYKMANDLADDPKAYVGTQWDSVTAIHQYLLDQVIDKEINEQAEIVEKARKMNKRAGNITVRDRFETDGDDYAYMSQQLRHLLRLFRYLPCHFVVTALVRTLDDRQLAKSKQAKTHAPAINPALQNDLAGYVDIVMRTGIAETPDGLVWFGRTVGGDDEDNKDRFHRLPYTMVNPTFPRVLAYVRGELTEETDPDQRLLSEKDTPKVGQTKAAKPKPTGTPVERAAARRATKQETPDEAQAEAPATEPQPEAPKTTTTRKTAAQRRLEKEEAERAATKSRDEKVYGDDPPPY